MQSDPVLVAQVAEKLGWCKKPAQIDDLNLEDVCPHYRGRLTPGSEMWVDKDGHRMLVQDFTPDINMGQCWEYIVKAMAEKGFDFVLHIDSSGGGDGFAEFFKGASIWDADFESIAAIPAAVCEAALQVAKKEE